MLNSLVGKLVGKEAVAIVIGAFVILEAYDRFSPSGNSRAPASAEIIVAEKEYVDARFQAVEKLQDAHQQETLRAIGTLAQTVENLRQTNKTLSDRVYELNGLVRRRSASVCFFPPYFKNASYSESL